MFIKRCACVWVESINIAANNAQILYAGPNRKIFSQYSRLFQWLTDKESGALHFTY